MTTEIANPFALTSHRVTTDDGVGLHCEEVGRGAPILFLHEFSGSVKSWKPQISRLARSFRCVTFNARGYPPSDVPERVESYSQSRATADALAVLDRLGIEQAHVLGLSMGGFTALNLAATAPQRVKSVIIGACGYGAEVSRERFIQEMESISDAWLAEGVASLAHDTALGPYRIGWQSRDPIGWLDWAEALAEHDAVGASHTIRGVQAHRPTLLELIPRLKAVGLPLLSIVGDEDDPCLDANLTLKRQLPSASLAILPGTGHTVNLEEPEAFNRLVAAFIRDVDAGTWMPRDPRSIRESGGWVR